MDRDELRDEIAGWFFKNVDCEDPHYFPADKARYWADSTLSLLAPVLADAAKWRRFLAIQSCNDCPACPECPCDYTNCPAQKIEDALEGR